MNCRQTDFEIICNQIVQMGRIHSLIKRVIEKCSFAVIKSESCFANPRPSEFSGGVSVGIDAKRFRNGEKSRCTGFR